MTFRGWWIRLTDIFRRNERERRMEQEFQTHLEMQIESNLRSGMSAEEARRFAMISAGGMQSARENYRQQGGLPFFETLLQDVRYGLRVLRKTPGFTLVAVLTLALGIGANTAIFSLINAVLLSPLPFRDPDRLVHLWETESAPGNYPFSGPDYLEWQAQNKTLEGMTAYGWPNGFNASNGADAQSVVGLPIQANFFSLLGVQPLMGRTFASDENQPGKNRVVILTYGFWKKFYGGQHDIIDRKLMLDGEEHAIVGVMPRALSFPSEVELYVPMDMTSAAMHRRGSHWFRALGKLKPGETVSSAKAELATIAKNLERQFPDTNDKVSAVVVPLREEITGSSREALLVLLGAVGLVLLVACFNVANLLLARATGRQREVALRAVLGASRSRIIRQLLTESVLLSFMGALLGLAGAWWCIRLFQNAESLPIPRTNPIELNITVLMFTFLVSVAVGIIFGLAPALQTSRLDLGEELKSGSQSVLSPGGWNRRLRDLLVVAEIALSLALLAGAGLLIRSFQNLRTAETGVKAENVMTFSTLLPKAGYEDISRQRGFFDQLLERLTHSPGVTGAGLATELPVEGGSNGYIKAEGDTDPGHANLLVEENYITSGYFAALGVPFLSGNNFSPADMDRAAEMTQGLIALRKSDPNSKVTPPDVSFPVIISQSMAKTYWPHQDPIGKVYRSQNGTIPYHVIGVVGDVSTGGVRQQSLPQSYHPFTEALGDSGAFARVVVRSAMPATALLPEMRNQLRQLDSSLAIFHPRTMTEVISESMQDAAWETWLLGSFAGLALLLAAVGLYSVLSYLVNQRTREIGIRMALGAGQSTILRLVMGHAAVLTGIGILCGIVGSLILTRFLESLLYGVKGRDPVTFIGVVVVLALVSLVACYVPARRAMRVDPLVALRYE